MNVPLVAGMDTEQDSAHPPPMAGVVVGAIVSIFLWAAIGGIAYLVVISAR